MHKNIKIEQGVILVGGYGTRLGNITKKIPKPLLKINNIPFVEYLIKNFSQYGVKKVLFLTSYKSKIFFKKYNNKKLHGIKITCHDEKEAKGTGGALYSALNKLDQYFYFCNGDTYFNINLLNFNVKFKNSDILSIGICKNKKKTRYSGVRIKKNKVLGFNDSRSNYVNSGYYLVNKKIFSFFKVRTKTFSFEKDLIPDLISKKIIKFTLFNKKNFLDIGIKNDLKKAPKHVLKNRTNKAIFLDRDGVINYDYGYVHKIKDFKWRPKIIESIKYFNDNNYFVFIVSNQSGVGRGYYKEKDVKKLENYIQKILNKNGAHIDDFHYSFYFKDSKFTKYKKKSNLRKPNLGMYNILKRKWKFNVKKSIMIGDQISDINFGKKTGLKTFNIKNYKNIFQIIKKYSI